jgi:hypothetical protein
MPTPEFDANKSSQVTRLKAELSKQISNRKVLTIGRKNGPLAGC